MSEEGREDRSKGVKEGGMEEWRKGWRDGKRNGGTEGGTKMKRVEETTKNQSQQYEMNAL